jgi:MFS family permease
MTRLSQPRAYALDTAVIGLALFASATPSPLYGTYRELWGFSPAVLTLVYATYAFGVLASLLLAGRVSDDVGRRPVLIVALSMLLLTSVLFMVADSVAWLFVARGLQGLATGLALGAASAAMLDLHARRDPAGVGLANGVVSASGMGLGVLVTAALIEWLPAPRVLPYVVLFVLFAVSLLGAIAMPEPVERRTRPRLTPQRPRVPAGVRRPFLLAALAVLSSWSVGGLFLSLGPQLTATLFDSSDLLVAGLGAFVLSATGALAQLALGNRMAPWRGASYGSVALAAGVLIIVASASASAESGALLMVGTVVGGAGFGLAFLGALRQLTGVIPPHHRAEVMSAFYLVAYTSLSLPAVAAGFLVTSMGLEPTFELFGSIAAAVALIVAFEAGRTRPAEARRARRAVPA